MKRYTRKDIVISAIVLAAVVIISTVFGILKTTNVLKTDASSFLIILTGLTLGFGGYILGFALVKKGGYELGVGGVLFTVGIVLLLVCLKVHYAIIIAVGVALVLLSLISMFAIKAPQIAFVPTDEEKGYVPYMDELRQKKIEEKANEEELPEIKSFK